MKTKCYVCGVEWLNEEASLECPFCGHAAAYEVGTFKSFVKNVISFVGFLLSLWLLPVYLIFKSRQ